MKAAELVMAEARERGLRHFFGIPGGGLPLDLMAAGQKLGVDFVNVCHESSAAIMAAYYGSLRGAAGLAMGIRGVGALNLVSGAGNVHFERYPAVTICETCSPDQAGHQMVQHLDHHQLFQCVTKYQVTLTPEAASEQVREAFRQAEEGRPGPTFLNFPSDLNEVAVSARSAASTPVYQIDEEGLADVRRELAKSRRPVVLAGGDVIRAGAVDELRRLVKNIQAAVLVTMDARGVFPETHPRWAGVYMGFFFPKLIETRILNQADLVLMVGVDSMMTHSPWKLSLPACELAARPEYSSLCPAPTARASGNLKGILDRLSAQSEAGFPADEVRKTRDGILGYFRRPKAARLAIQDVLEITRRLLPSEGMMFSESAAFIGMLEHLWLVEEPRRFFGSSGGRAMGLAVPSVLGARLADPETPMVGLGADGSLLMRLGELEVFSRMQVAVPLIIINDQALGTIKSRQKSRRLPDYGLNFHPVDFSAVARSFGLLEAKVETPEAFETALSKALRADRTTLIDVRVDPEIYQHSFGPTIGVVEPFR